MKSLPTALCALLLFASVGHADVRYTTHVEVRRATGADRAHVPDLGAIMQALAPPGDTVTYVSADSIRIEQSRGATKSVVLLRRDGQIILDPAARTYLRVAEGHEVLKSAESLAPPTFKRTGEFATILGVRAERIVFTMSVPLPVTPPAGFPTVMTVEGEVWLGKLSGPGAIGLREATGLSASVPISLEGMVLKQVIRSEEFGYEVETTVTELVEGPVAAEMFRVPPDYREVTGVPLR